MIVHAEETEGWPMDLQDFAMIKHVSHLFLAGAH